MAKLRKKQKIHFRMDGVKVIWDRKEAEEAELREIDYEKQLKREQKSDNPYVYIYEDRPENFFNFGYKEFEDISLEELIAKERPLLNVRDYYYTEKEKKDKKTGETYIVKQKHKEYKRIKKRVYPRKYYDPTDVEKDLDNVEHVFFNASKTLRKYNLLFLTKILPIHFLDKMTFNNKFFDKIALKQHNKVKKLNNSEIYQQKDYDRSIIRNKTISYSILGFLAFCLVFLKMIPSIVYSYAERDFIAGNYDSAKSKYDWIFFYDNASYMSDYCKGKLLLDEGKYDEAEKVFKLLSKNTDKLSDNVPMNEVEYDTLYQKALQKYSDKDYVGAQEIFRNIYQYKESTQYYYKCGYEIASKLYEEGKLEESLDAFYQVQKYKDAKSRFEKIAEQLYQDALTSYHDEKFDEAYNKFYLLVPYEYKDSASMVKQCSYHVALNQYLAGQYEKATNILSKLTNYKDGNLLYKESAYKYAISIMNTDPSKALEYFTKILNYRDVPSKLKSSASALYGKWDVVSVNEASVSDYELTVYMDNVFVSNKTLAGLLTSDNKNLYSYHWDGSKFVSTDDKYSIVVKGNDMNNINIIASNGEQTVTYALKRTASGMSIGSFDGSKTTSKTTKDIIQSYIDKKIDKNIKVNGKETNMDIIRSELINSYNDEELKKDLESNKTDDNKKDTK